MLKKLLLFSALGLVAIAFNSKNEYPFVLTSPTVAAYTGEHAYETFTHTQSVNITDTDAVDISATLFSKTVQNVPFKRNRITKLSGAMYTNSSTGGSFQLSTDWETEYSGSF